MSRAPAINDCSRPWNCCAARSGAAAMAAASAWASASQSEVAYAAARAWSRAGVARQPRRRGVADPAPRPIGDSLQRDGVVRVVDRLQIGDPVLPLGAL